MASRISVSSFLVSFHFLRTFLFSFLSCLMLMLGM